MKESTPPSAVSAPTIGKNTINTNKQHKKHPPKNQNQFMLAHLPHDHNAQTVSQQLIPLIQSLPEKLRKTLTWDQGSEMSEHKTISLATNMTIYFCDPHSPWQRGSNENTNGLLRQYFPKNTDLSMYDQQYLNQVAEELNNHPRKTLDWLTPNKKIHQILQAPA